MRENEVYCFLSPAAWHRALGPGSSPDGHPGTWVWIGSEDIEPLCAEFLAKGTKLRHPPTNYPWAYEMQIEDPDGNVLRFGSDPKPDQPFGPWLDMHGKTRA